jgi:hypothetical protein
MKTVWRLLQFLSQHCAAVVFENNFFGIGSERTRRENLPMRAILYRPGRFAARALAAHGTNNTQETGDPGTSIGYKSSPRYSGAALETTMSEDFGGARA